MELFVAVIVPNNHTARNKISYSSEKDRQYKESSFAYNS